MVSVIVPLTTMYKLLKSHIINLKILPLNSIVLEFMYVLFGCSLILIHFLVKNLEGKSTFLFKCLIFFGIPFLFLLCLIKIIITFRILFENFRNVF